MAEKENKFYEAGELINEKLKDDNNNFGLCAFREEKAQSALLLIDPQRALLLSVAITSSDKS